MTAQFEDEFRLRGGVWSLIGMSGSGLFDPSDHGIAVEGHCTACYRGFLCRYDIDDEGIFLVQLLVMGPRGEVFPPLGGVAPGPGGQLFDAVYDDLRLTVPYDGGILLGNDLIEDQYVHMGFQKPHAYARVRELIFSKGRLKREADHSELFRDLRAVMSRMAGRGQHDLDSTGDWIATCFDVDYRSWPILRDPGTVLAGRARPYMPQEPR